MLATYRKATRSVSLSRPSGDQWHNVDSWSWSFDIKVFRFVPFQPGPDCPMTVDAERLEGDIVQVGAGGRLQDYCAVGRKDDMMK